MDCVAASSNMLVYVVGLKLIRRGASDKSSAQVDEIDLNKDKSLSGKIQKVLHLFLDRTG